MKYFAGFILSGLIALSAGFGISPAVNAQFDAAKNQACEGLGAGDDFINCDASNASGDTGVQGIIKVALNILSFIAGVIAVIIIIISGIKFITSQGDSSAVATARSSVIYALVGLIIVALAQVIVFFVLNQASTDPAPPEPAAPIILEEGESCPRGRVCAE